MTKTKLIEVTKEEFFDALFQDRRDIMPSIVGAWVKGDNVTTCGYWSEWKSYPNQLFGKSFGNGDNNKYWLNKEV